MSFMMRALGGKKPVSALPLFLSLSLSVLLACLLGVWASGEALARRPTPMARVG